MTNVIVRRPLRSAYIENMPYLGNTNLPMFRTLMHQNEMPDVQYGMKPAANITEDEHKYIIDLAVPSFSKEDISIEVRENMLTVKGHKPEAEEPNFTFHLKQFNVNTFSRNFRMPPSADMNNIEAEMKDGILRLSVLKIQKAAPKKIEIQ